MVCCFATDVYKVMHVFMGIPLTFHICYYPLSEYHLVVYVFKYKAVCDFSQMAFSPLISCMSWLDSDYVAFEKKMQKAIKY